MKVLYVPLDDRACNYEFPYALSRLTDNIELLRPPHVWMGFLKQGADVEKIWDWIFQNAGDCEYAILCVDTLVYGNLVNSRIHNLSIDVCMERMDRFRELKEKIPKIKLHAFNLVARVAAYNNSFEDPMYWDVYGYDIWRYTCFLDRESRGEISEREREEKNKIEKKIPEEVMTDFVERRNIDREVNKKSALLVKDNVFDTLNIPKDDNGEYGMSAMDSQVMLNEVNRLGISHRVYIYPGTDEVACNIFTRIFCESKSYLPRVYVRYSATNAPFVVPKYEDRLLGESIKWQIHSAGGIFEECAEFSDCMLAVNMSGTKQVEASRQKEDIDSAFRTSINIHEFLNYIKFYRKIMDKSIGIAEISCCNGCENSFMEMMMQLDVFPYITAFGGWNTAQNTIGVVLSHIIRASFYKGYRNNVRAYLKSESFKLGFLLSDWVCQTLLQDRVSKEVDDIKNLDLYRLKENHLKIREWYMNELEMWFNEFLNKYGWEKSFAIKNFDFDWDSVYFYNIVVSEKNDHKNL